MKNSTALILGLCHFLGCIWLAMALNYGMSDINPTERTVTVKGLAEREVMADNVIWPIMFTNQSNDISTLYSNINEDSEIVKNYLIQNGITENEITIVAPSINDIGTYSTANNMPVDRYNATTTITVNSAQVEKVVALTQSIISLLEEGVILSTEQYNIQYKYNSLNDIKPEMVEEATINARHVAEKFAEDSESSLGRIKTASQGVFSIETPDSYNPQIKLVRVVSTIEYFLVD